MIAASAPSLFGAPKDTAEKKDAPAGTDHPKQRDIFY